MKKAVKNILNILLLIISISGIAQVGIGTTSPNAQLDVDGGTVRFSTYGNGINTGNSVSPSWSRSRWRYCGSE